MYTLTEHQGKLLYPDYNQCSRASVEQEKPETIETVFSIIWAMTGLNHELYSDINFSDKFWWYGKSIELKRLFKYNNYNYLY